MPARPTSRLNGGKTAITVSGNITASGSGSNVTLLFNGGAANVSGVISANNVTLLGNLGAGTANVNTNAPNIFVGGGSAILVKSGYGGRVSVSSSGGLAVKNLAVIAGGSLNATGLTVTSALALSTPGPLSLTGSTLGSATLLQSNSVPTVGGITNQPGSTVQLAAFTPSTILGVNTTGAPPATQVPGINYLPGYLTGSFANGTKFIIGGVAGGVSTTGNIHVGADGPFNLGSDSITFATTGTVFYYPNTGVITTLGTVDIVLDRLAG